jgi:hypothetical protein
MSDLLNVPGGHSTQFSDLPVEGLNVPLGHCWHSVCPSRGWYHPAGHSTHADCPTRNCTLPGLHGSHMQLFHFIVLPDTDVTWFGSQTAHSLTGQHPVPRPPPLRHPFSLKKT